MNTQQEFKAMLDEILVEIIKENNSGNKRGMPILTNNVINMLRNLQRQIEEQQVQIDELQKQLRDMEQRNLLLLRASRKIPG